MQAAIAISLAGIGLALGLLGLTVAGVAALVATDAGPGPSTIRARSDTVFNLAMPVVAIGCSLVVTGMLLLPPAPA